MKNKVEAYEAVFKKEVVICPSSSSSSSSSAAAVLPVARVLVHRLTSQDLIAAGVKNVPKTPARNNHNSDKRGTFVKPTADCAVDAPASQPMAADQPRRKSVAQVLARKSLDKARQLALSAARHKFLTASVQDGSESVSVAFTTTFT